ncbi:MAG TPA: trigger factor [Burkholderiales bacterium]|nr:trigger factor [Burkholderiales bacterium]
MQATIEKVSNLERRLNVALPAQEIDAEVANRLKRLARTVRMHGFRPGKVPYRLVEAQFGGQVRQEVLGDALQKSFGEAVRQQNLRVAGYPRFELTPQSEAADQPASDVQFSATFEVYPDIVVGDLADVAIDRPQVPVGDAEIDKTIEILRKQRVHYDVVERPVQSGDRIVIDYAGTIEGAPFAGGTASDHETVLGEGRLLPDFESNILGMSPGEQRSFELTFPEDYHGKDVAGKTVRFEVTLKRVAAAHLPEVDAEFAKSLGVVDGDVAKMREDIRANLEREVRRRCQARVKDQVMKALLEKTTIELPNALVQMETERLMEGMRRDFAARGMKAEDVPMPREAFEPEARKRVALGLIVAELVRRENLVAQPDQVKAIVQDYAQSYERPEEVVRWYYQSPERLREVESLVLENNVVDWVLGRVKVEDKPTDFDELMGNAK